VATEPPAAHGAWLQSQNGPVDHLAAHFYISRVGNSEMVKKDKIEVRQMSPSYFNSRNIDCVICFPTKITLKTYFFNITSKEHFVVLKLAIE
jgi:hypothetical protein